MNGEAETQQQKPYICISLDIGRPGVRRKVEPGQLGVEDQGQAAMLHISKSILDSPELEQIAMRDRREQAWVRGWSLPSLFKEGVYVLPVGKVGEVTERLKGYRGERVGLIEGFMGMYQQRQEEALKALGPLGNVLDYPAAEAIRVAFRFDWKLILFDVPTQLRLVSQELWQEETAKLQAATQEMIEAGQQLLRGHFLKLVEHMVERLTPEVDGRRKIFKQPLIDGMVEAMEQFKALNTITTDAELAGQVERMKGLLRTGRVDGWLSAKDIRDDEALGVAVGAGMAQIGAVLGGMVERVPVRRFKMERVGD